MAFSFRISNQSQAITDPLDPGYVQQSINSRNWEGGGTLKQAILEARDKKSLGLSRLRQRQASRAASLIGDPSAVNTTLLG